MEILEKDGAYVTFPFADPIKKAESNHFGSNQIFRFSTFFNKKQNKTSFYERPIEM